MSSAIVDRLLKDAQTSSGRGDSELALNLLVTALDAAPHDPGVLLRAQQIKQSLRVGASHDLPLDERFAAVPSAAALSQAPAGPPPAFPVIKPPEQALLSGQVVDGVQIIHKLHSSRERAERVRELRVQGAARREHALAVRRSRSLARSLWIIGALIGGVFVIAIRQPPFVQRAIASAIQRFDDVAAADAALSRGDTVAARASIERFKDKSDNSGVAHLVLSRFALLTHDSAGAATHAVQALRADTAAAVALAAGEVTSKLSDPNTAADIYQIAFDRGAGIDTWRVIISAQLRAGRQARAQNILSLWKRADPAAAKYTLQNLPR